MAYKPRVLAVQDGGTGINATTANQLLYSSASNTIAGLATANSGVLTTSTSGVPSIDTTNFHVLTTGIQVKGNNTNTAPPAGFIGEQITANASSVAFVNNTGKTITSINLTAGVWDVSAYGFHFFTGTNTSASLGISATNNTMPAGNAGQNFATMLPYGGTAANGGVLLTIPPQRVVISSTTTYYLVGLVLFSGGTCSSNGYITATRVG